MSTTPIATRPPNKSEALLREKFTESVVKQADLMDSLAKQLLTLELAIPGLYATVLKLLAGDKAVLQLDALLLLTFAFWFAAVIATLIALWPRSYTVDTKIMRSDGTGPMGIEDFFRQSARYKSILLIISSMFFLGGVIFAVLSAAI